MSKIAMAFQSGKSLEQATLHANLEINAERKVTSGVILSMYGTLYSHTLRLLKENIARDQNLLTIIENTPDIICRYDKDCRRIFVNPAFVKLSGSNVAALLGKKLPKHSGKQIIEINETQVKEVFATGKNTQVELKISNNNGKEICNLIQLTAERDSSGTVNSVLAVGRDITELHKSSSELNLALDTLRFNSNILNTVKEGIFLVSAIDGLIVFTNPQFDKMFGYDSFELLGKHVSTINAPGEVSSEEVATSIMSDLDSTGMWAGEIHHIRKDGTTFWSNAKVSTFTHPQFGKVWVSAHEDITKQKIDKEEIQYLAFYDQLTKLPNRRHLRDRLQQALAAHSRSGNEGALLLIDLDNFKTLNDTLGHDIGDLLLQEVARRLTSGVRKGDTIARLGGDEFVVLLEDIKNKSIPTVAQIESVGKKILDAVSLPFHINKHACHVTTSIGVTLFKGNENGLDELLKQAEIALYQAKKDGRNSLRYFDPQMQNIINTRALMERELRIAIDTHQLVLHYQIQVDDAYRPLGAEALIRWIHPVRGLVSPAQFIPLAEETGVILLIGQWVIENACEQLKKWQINKLTRKLVLAVNVSAKQFHQTDFVEQVKSSIRRHDIDPQMLKFELTESLFLNDLEVTISTMSELKEIGIMFSLDDFGTGYSSLQYLKRLPLHQLKIDQSFVRDISTDSSDKAIVSTIIVMARSLKLNVIAEGVETEDQRKFLKKKGCKHYQGYLFGKPMPIEQFESMLKRI